MANLTKSIQDFVQDVIKTLVNSGILFKQTQGGKGIKIKPIIEYNHPWRIIRTEERNCCIFWKDTLWHLIVRQSLPEELQFIPSPCHDCYKVVVKPQAYYELLALEDLIKELDYPSKCGCEYRNTVQGLYGGYFWCRGLQEGRERLKEVKEAVTMPVFLKRACTEYELAHGPSNKWVVTDFQRELEDEIFKRISFDLVQPPQSREVIDQMHEKWRRFAWKFDPTYSGERLYPRFVTY